MRLTKDYKWTYYRLVEGMYSILPPEKIRSRCGIEYAEKIFPSLKNDLWELGIDIKNYPRFHPETEEQAEKVIALLNNKWVKYLDEEIKKRGI